MTGKFITFQCNRTAGSYWKSIVILLVVVILFPVSSFTQVINNSGAVISVEGAVVGVKDIENNTGSLGNNGVLNISGNFLNANPASAYGNGSYNLNGNWTNNGAFSAGTSTVTFLTGANQTITHGSAGETFYILTINNPGRTITHISNAGGTLTILNNLNLTAGTFSLHSTTATLIVGGKATIGGALIYNGITPQTASVGDVLSGAGTIDMSGGSLPHYLYLAGSTNGIGTFITSASGSSTVNYNGTTQTVFSANNYRNLIISNSGIKTLLGNSTVGINLNITGGTFDLGTTATTLGVLGNTNIDGGLSFNNTSTKTVTLTGNLSGTGSIDMGGSSLSHLLYLAGTTNTIGSYSSGTGSTVNYTKNAPQSLFASDNYRNLTISGSGLKSMSADISASGILTMSGGNIDAGTSTLKVTNSAIAAINRTTGNVIGKLQRAIGVTGSDYLYPLGTPAVYNPLKLSFNNLVSGQLTAQFKTGDIGNAGLPLDDNGNEIWDRFTTGYWTLTSVAPMATASFDVKATYTGFGAVDGSSSIIKRTNGGNLELDGTHGTLTASEISRTILVNGISATTTDIAIGKGRAKIDIQPSPIDICELSNAFFAVSARGRGTLTYQWQVNTGSGFTSISNGGVYSGANTNHLTLTGAPYSMNGYTYRCIITDGQGNTNITVTVLLTVNKIPVATASPTAQNECPGVAFTNIVLGTANGVTGTTFAWSRTNPAGITTTLPLTGSATGDQIAGTFTNTLDAPIIVTFTIIPTGPATTFCIGNPITVNVTVNPTARVFTLPATTVQCDSIATNIRLTSPSTFTSGVVTFKYSVTETGSVSGYTTPVAGISNNAFITDRLKNNTDVYQIVTYRVVPVSPVGCVDGPSVNATVTVNPTPRVVPVNVKPDICPAGAAPTQSQVTLTSPTVMSSGYGVMRFDYAINLSPGIIGNSSPEVNKLPGYSIVNGYQNTTSTIQSVYYTITPKVDNAMCVPGRRVTAEVKVHAKPLQGLIITTPLTCDGGSDAGLRAVTATGAGLYYYDWVRTLIDQVHGYSIPDLFNRKGGRWDVAVTDNLGCKNAGFVFVEGAYLDSYLYVVDTTGYGTTCPGSNDGQIWIKEKNSSTGIAPFNYWIVRNSQDTVITGTLAGTDILQKYYNQLPGNYKLFLKDANGCYDQSFPEVNIIEPDIINVSFDATKYPVAGGGFANVSCTGYNNGSVWAASVTGGNGGYRYKWTKVSGTIAGVDTLTRIDNVSAGTYNLKVTDRKGCTNTLTVVLTEPSGMDLAGSTLSHSPDNNFNISCNGGNDGSISMIIVGGSGNYLFSWTSPNGFTATTRDISGLKAGVYSCTVTDVNGCTLAPASRTIFTLTEPAALAIGNINSVSNDGAFNINCFAGTGSINLSVSGGSAGNYTYTWSTANGSGIVQGQEDQSALTAGTYHVIVKDLNNCVVEKDITLTQPPDFALQLHATNITCQAPAFDNGSIDLAVSGGVGPFTYTWSNGATTQDVAGLTEGSYNVTVTYNNTCSKSDAASVSLPPVLTYTKALSAYNSYNISCFGMSNGSILIEPTSGVAPFVYTWTGSGGFTATTKYISNLKAGQYNLHIIDSNYCTVDEVINLTEPGQLGMTFTLSSSITGGHNINCAGDSTGTISVEPLNLVNSGEYLWSDGASGKTRNNLSAGSYGIILTDANNCQASSTVILTQPDSIKLSFSVTQPFCPDKPDGEIRLTATGGIKGTDYIYKWSDNSTTSTISNLLKGLYKVVVTDLNLCQVKDSVNIEPQNESCLVIPNAFSPNDDLINDVWNIDMIELYPNMEISVYNRWSQLLWKSEKGYAIPWDGKSKGKALPIDSYHYLIDLHNGTKPIVGNITIVR
jgi:gliding motility-associated-like protein